VIAIKENEMVIPDLSAEDIKTAMSDATDIELLSREGGQKIVFTGLIENKKWALKFMRPNLSSSADQSVEDSVDDVTARAQREVETMQQCQSPFLVRPGPIGIKSVYIKGEPYIFFTEEFIPGIDLKNYKKKTGVLPIPEITKLGIHISEAISSIWNWAKIHRDVKPGNIMRKGSNGDFILLDMGLVFDLNDASLSLFGPVGTPIYFSPEQMDFNHRRTVLDFRSDLFSLGIVLYEMATGQHPFINKGTTSSFEVVNNIRTMAPENPCLIRKDLPQGLGDIIIRLLAKRPALRFRQIGLLIEALTKASVGGK